MSTDHALEHSPSQTLTSPTLNFPIVQLVPNPTGKLLAVVGAHQLVVVVLPRPGYVKLVTPTIECRSIPIGLYYHSPASPLISKVLWHPYGSLSSSLLVLTLDGLLREYDPLQDSEEPQQTVSLLPPRARTAGGAGRFEAEERGAREAVSFCLGKGEGDWGMLSVYGLMGNGDVYGVCPFLPANA
jgi:nucleoporin NUP82